MEKHEFPIKAGSMVKYKDEDRVRFVTVLYHHYQRGIRLLLENTEWVDECDCVMWPDEGYLNLLRVEAENDAEDIEREYIDRQLAEDQLRSTLHAHYRMGFLDGQGSKYPLKQHLAEKLLNKLRRDVFVAMHECIERLKNSSFDPATNERRIGYNWGIDVAIGEITHDFTRLIAGAGIEESHQCTTERKYIDKEAFDWIQIARNEIAEAAFRKDEVHDDTLNNWAQEIQCGLDVLRALVSDPFDYRVKMREKCDRIKELEALLAESIKCHQCGREFGDSPRHFVCIPCHEGNLERDEKDREIADTKEKLRRIVKVMKGEHTDEVLKWLEEKGCLKSVPKCERCKDEKVIRRVCTDDRLDIDELIPCPDCHENEVLRLKEIFESLEDSE